MAKQKNTTKLTSRGYELEVMGDGSTYNKKRVVLHTTDKALIDKWHKRFSQFIEIAGERDIDSAENLYCNRGLEWIGNQFRTIDAQFSWVEQGIEFYSSMKNKPIYSFSIGD